MNSLEITTEQAEKLVEIIKRGSVRSGVLVMKSLVVTLDFKRKLKEERNLDTYLYKWDIKR